MNEDLQIEKAAHLADKPGAEDLATDRAKRFVSEALASKSESRSGLWGAFSRRPFFAWGSVAVALAACVAVAVLLFRPDSTGTGYGTPAQLLEGQSIHAGTEVVDSTASESSDSLTIEHIIQAEDNSTGE